MFQCQYCGNSLIAGQQTCPFCSAIQQNIAGLDDSMETHPEYSAPHAVAPSNAMGHGSVNHDLDPIIPTRPLRKFQEVLTPTKDYELPFEPMRERANTPLPQTETRKIVLDSPKVSPKGTGELVQQGNPSTLTLKERKERLEFQRPQPATPPEETKKSSRLKVLFWLFLLTGGFVLGFLYIGQVRPSFLERFGLAPTKSRKAQSPPSQKSQEWNARTLQRARLFAKQRQWKQAIRLLIELAAKPESEIQRQAKKELVRVGEEKDAEKEYNWARKLYQMKRYREAKAYLKKIAPKSQSAKMGAILAKKIDALIVKMDYRQARRAYKRKKYKLALKKYHQIFEVEPLFRPAIRTYQGTYEAIQTHYKRKSSRCLRSCRKRKKSRRRRRKCYKRCWKWYSLPTPKLPVQTIKALNAQEPRKKKTFSLSGCYKECKGSHSRKSSRRRCYKACRSLRTHLRCCNRCQRYSKKRHRSKRKRCLKRCKKSCRYQCYRIFRKRRSPLKRCRRKCS